ncbi:hypothetical protein CBER1_01102 [Cercospora berteroae]|uniref:Uncharacterized protein n=1 Tax=Cercospora berteroae TaxID=357750 RepID=A0A2S6C361_9PEZI|nr:hypothetical protein CBER1_01102 [Cercospora berteroae]
MWNTVKGVKLDPESPLAYNLWTTAENQGPMLYSDEAQRLKTDLATKTRKELNQESADRWLKRHGHRKCPNNACRWQFMASPSTVHMHFGRVRGDQEEPNSERDIRAFHLVEYFDFSSHAVSLARNTPREPVYAADITRLLGGLSRKEYIERQIQQKPTSKAAKAATKAIEASAKVGSSKRKK